MTTFKKKIIQKQQNNNKRRHGKPDEPSHWTVRCRSGGLASHRGNLSECRSRRNQSRFCAAESRSFSPEHFLVGQGPVETLRADSSFKHVLLLFCYQVEPGPRPCIELDSVLFKTIAFKVSFNLLGQPCVCVRLVKLRIQIDFLSTTRG